MPKIHARQALTATGWENDVAVTLGADGRISQIESADPNAPGMLDLLLPAPTNLHSHTFQRAMAGLTETRGSDPRDSFWTWRQLMYRFLDQLTPDQVQTIAAQAFMEMLEAGFGAVAEFHYLHHSPDGTPYDTLAEMAHRITASAEETGIGLTLLPVLYSQGGCDGRELAGGQLRFGNGFERYQRLWQDAAEQIAQGPFDFRIGVAPHSLRAVRPDDLARAAALAKDAPLHLHIAEQVAEVEEALAHLGARPVEWLLANHDIGPDWCLVHATQMTRRETRALARSGAVAGLCPITEANLGDGIFDGVNFAETGGQFGIGTDSNVQIDLFGELRALEYSQRLRDHRRAALARPEGSTGRMLFETCAAGGAQAAGRNSGVIAEGRIADLVGLSTDNDWICGRARDALLDSLVFTGRGGDCVREVWSAGRHVVQAGRHVARDAISARFRAVMADLGQAIA